MRGGNKFIGLVNFKGLAFCLFVMISAATSFSSFAQDPARITIPVENRVGVDYTLSLEPLTIAGFDGLQSFAAGQLGGKWVLIGGRTDGLHRRMPFAAFAPEGFNSSIFVIEPESKKISRLPVGELPAPVSEHLQATNMQFIQRGATLYLIGGYGFSRSAGNYLTHDELTAANLDCLIPAVEKGNSAAAACFRQISDPLFTVTGGQIGRLGEVFYLIGGQNFRGRYNPMGPDHGPGFFQKYTDQIRKFRLLDDGVSLRIEPLPAVTDETNLHRRDFNMLPQIFPDGASGFTVFSGVFRPDADLPFLDTVDVHAEKHLVNRNFTQYLNHYHSAKIALYDGANKKMENIFFGGISQFEEAGAGVLSRDDDVPFVNAIGKVTRDKDGKMSETKIGEMPALLGAGAEFLLDSKLPKYENDIVKLNEIKGERALLGYVVGGIKSPAKNIFRSSMGRMGGGGSGRESDASPVIYKVWLSKTAKKAGN